VSARSEASKNREAIRTAYYKWEFLRRNSEYRRDYAKFNRTFGVWIKKHGRHPWMIDKSDAATRYYFDRIYPEEYKLREKWGVYFPKDPKYNMDFQKIPKSIIDPHTMPILPAFCARTMWVWRNPEPIHPDWRLDLYICLAGPKADIMDQVEMAIDIELSRRRKIIEKPKNKTRKRLDHYSDYLKVWDLYQTKKGFRMVAEAIWPDEVSYWDTNPKGNRRNPLNPIVQRAKDQYQAARRLIEGGYRDLR
jgi:hypothetical protein